MSEFSAVFAAAKVVINQSQKILQDQSLTKKITELEKQMQADDFWLNHSQAEKISRECSRLKKILEVWQELAKELQDLEELAEFSAKEEIENEVQQFQKKLRQAEVEFFLNGEFDENDAILSIQAGAGGVDAADWAEMLLRMYLRLAEKKNWQTQILEKSTQTEAGIKSAVLEIRGEYAFGFLRGESGSHRLVRRSPFNSIHSRETSFAKVEILPKIPEDSSLALKPSDLRIDTFCSSGAGGQHVNKTESAVRITHLPSGIVVTCQSERSQLQNKTFALELLRARLAEKKLQESENQKRILRGDSPKADFGGDTIRSYILDDKRVKDTRTGVERFDPEKVLDGEITDFLEAFLFQERKNLN